MRNVFQTLVAAAAAALLPSLSWAAERLPEPLVRFAFADDSLTNTGTLTLQSQPTVAGGFTFTDATDANGVTRRALKSTGDAVTNVDLAAEDIKVSGSTVSFWTTTTTGEWRDAVGVDFLFDPAESARTWQAWERMKDANKMAVYGVTGPSDVSIGDTDKLHHWAMVGEGTHLSFYFDGRFLGRYDKSSQITEDSLLAAFGFGGSAARNAQRGVASTADARIYGVPLSPAKVAYLASGETIGFCEASVEGEQVFSGLTWDEGEAYEDGTTSVMGLRLASGATLELDCAVTLDRLFLSVPEGTATVRLSGEGSLAGVGEIVVFGNVDFGSAAIPSLNIATGATVTVEARSQIATLNQAGTLRLAGGDALEALSVDATVTVGQTLAVAKKVTTGALPISGRTLRIEPGADITVTTQFRTAHANDGGESVVNQTGGTLTCAGPAGADYKTGAFVLSHWPHITRYTLSGGALNVTESSAKLGADGTGNLTVSGTGVANLHSVSLKSGTLKVEAGGTLNLGAEAVPSATGVVGFNGGALELAGGTLGPWTRADLTIAGAVTVSADSIVRTSPAEGDTERAAIVAFTGALSGAGGLIAQGSGTLDISSATSLCEGGLSVDTGCSAKVGVWRPMLNAFGEGATLVLEATAAEIVAGRIDFPRAEGVSLVDVTVTVSNVPDATVDDDGAILLPSSKPKWTAGADNNTWSNVERWSNLGEGGIPTTGEVLVDFGFGPEAVTLTVDMEVSLDALTVSGTAAGIIALGENDALTVTQALRLATDLTLPASGLPPTVEVAEEKTLTLTGDHEALDVTFSGGGNLRFTDGTVKLTGGDFSGVADLTIGAGATVDFNGLSKTHAVILDGGTLANRASGAATVGAVTLTANSHLRAEGELRLQMPGNARNDLTLAGYTLEKSGAGLLSVMGAELATGTLSVTEGSLKLDTTSGGDCKLNGTTLRFAQGTSYQAHGWVELAGTVTVETEAEAAIAFTEMTLSGNGALTKTGAGALTVELKSSGNTQCYSGATRVEAGTLTFQRNNVERKSGTIYVAEGAALRKTGTGTLTYSGALSGAGVCEVAEGKVIVGAANGNFSGMWKVAAGATLSDEGNLNYNPFIGGDGEMVVDGTLELKPTSETNQGDAHIDGSLSGSGIVSVQANASISGVITLTGTLEIARGVTLKDVTSINGPNIVCAGILAPSTAKITVAEGTALSGTGTIQGTVTLEAGATLDATAGTLTVGSLAVPDGEGVVALKVATDAAKGTEVLRFATPVDVETFNEDVFTVEGSTLGVVPSSDGSALILTFVATFPDTVGADNGELTDSAASALLAAAERLGVTEVSTLTGRTYGRDLTAAELSGALECFVGEGLLSKGDATAEGTPLIVAYDFGISAITHNPDGSFTVTVRVQDAIGGDTVAFAEGTKVELYAPDFPNETLVGPKTIEGTPSVVTFEFPAARFSVRPLPFKARVRKE